MGGVAMLSDRCPTMSLLTRTKGYFVVICLLMCGFLLTFSWRLLYNTYDSSGLKPYASKTPLRRFKEIAQNLTRSSSVKVVPEVISDVMDKGQNGSKPFTKDEIGSILSKIHELGLSASEVQEKLLSWQHRGSFRNSSELRVLAKSPEVKMLERKSERTLVGVRGSESERASERESASERQQASEREQTSERERATARETPRGYGTVPLSPGKERFDDESVRRSVHTGDTGRNEITKFVHVSHDNPHSTPLLASSADHVDLPTQGRSRPSERLKDNTDRHRIQNNSEVKGRTDDKVKVAREENQNLISESRISGGDQQTAPGNKTDQKWKQREKYLLFLKERFEMSKSKTANLTSNKEQTSELNERISSPPTNTVTQKATKSRTKYDLSLFDELKRKYPTFSMNFQDNGEMDPEVDGTQRPDYCAGCFDFNFPIMINQEGLCKSNTGRSQNLQLLMLISSAPGNYQARTTIRQTWGARCRESDSMKCLFVVGRASSAEDNNKILLENDHHRDILQIGFKDSYSNLTYKTVSSLKWASKHCYNANYIMKTDDDMYVNTELIPVMLQAAPQRKFMGGSCWGTSNPNRDTSSKWFVSFKSFHKPKFPPMCSGTGYIMSIDVVRSMLFSSRNVPFFHLEDVYVALCLQKYGILPINIMGFSNMFQEFDACHYRNGVMTSHQVPPELLEEYWAATRKCPQANISPSQLYIIMPYPDT
ncbi:uncharacterized protein [Haliotis cracherodii]|uniref:uncharacterized protein n=1 Tax=Haliotis cracherodii TaxID=6455 RepID=UPI0039ED2D44